MATTEGQQERVPDQTCRRCDGTGTIRGESGVTECACVTDATQPKGAPTAPERD